MKNSSETAFNLKKEKFLIIILIFCSLILRGQSQNQTMTLLESQFRDPPESSKVWTWWHWMNGNVSQEGITADLESMKRVGIGGLYTFHVGEQLPFNGPVDFLSPQWWRLNQFAVQEARRLNLQFGFHNCPGWNASGGPEVKVEHSMQKLIWSETRISGPVKFEKILPLPKTDPQYPYYKDIVVLAFPDLQGAAISKNSVLNLSASMNASGHLFWDAPSGNWIIMRFGHTTTGKENYPAPIGGKGLECDKMSKEAVSDFFKSYPAKYLANATEVKNGIKHIEIDSYEAGNQDWTPQFREEFMKRRGYDPLVWLPAWANKTLESRKITDRFRYDMKLTIAELFNENYYGQFAKLVHQYSGLQLTLEPYDGPFNPFDVAEKADVLMGEFWQKPADWGWEWTKNVVGSAHFLGKKIISAEALTGWPHKSKWENDPCSLKASADKAFACGVNRLVLHTIAHQPWADSIRPGMTMSFWGTHFGRTQTWWEQSTEWFKYLNRCQYLLQKGDFVSDILCLNKHTAEVEGYRADVCSEAQFLKMVKFQNGRITLPHGKTYRLFVFSDTVFKPEVAQKIKRMADDGVPIIGKRFASSPSLQNYPDCDKAVKEISQDLWRRGKIKEQSLEQVLKEQNISPDCRASAAEILWAHRKLKEGDVYFLSNQLDSTQIVDCTFRISGKQPEIWDAATGEISSAASYSIGKDFTRLPVKLDPSGSVFVVFRHQTSSSEGSSSFNWPVYKTLEYLKVPWIVHFDPKGGGPSTVSFDQLTDWAQSTNKRIRYYSGTATYENQFELSEVPANLFIDLGKVKNLAEVKLNGVELGVLWKTPFVMDLTKAARKGKNILEIKITNLWANRLIGDEQEPPDVQWSDEETPVPQKNVSGGKVLMRLPDWFTEGKQRPSTGRFTFTTWNYFSKESPLLESGLLGPVRLITTEIR